MVEIAPVKSARIYRFLPNKPEGALCSADYRSGSSFSLSVIFTSIISVALAADDSDTPWVSLFNGKDLSGWVPIDVAPSTFRVRDGVIVSSGFPTGLLRTARQYENFVIELEWRHMKPGGNAGLFVWGDGLPAVGTPFARGMEVQILDNGFNAKGKNEWYTTHGDVFPVQGAKMTPTGQHLEYRPTEFSD